MKCYEGNNPYIFISYAHKDKDRVYPLVFELMKRGYRVWYDDGIRLSEEWPESIAYHLFNAESIIFFVSKSFCDSKNCKRELNFAIDKDKDMFAIFLDDEELSYGMQLQLGTVQSIRYDDESDVIHNLNKILENEVISKPQLVMSTEEFDEHFDVDVVQNTMINQMSVAIGIVKHNGQVLMLKRNSNENGLLWGFPATVVKPNEDFSLRIVKETLCETAVKTRFSRLLGTRVHPNTKAIVRYCALEYISGEVENLDDYENAEAKWVPLSSYTELITSNLYDKVKEYLEE